MKKACAALIALLLLFFAAPLFFAGILNLGNLFGIVVCVLALLCIKYNDAIKEFWVNSRKKRKLRWFLNSALCVVFAMVAVFFLLLSYVVSGGIAREEENLTLVVLGCQVKGESPSLMLSERLDAAYSYLSENKESVVIVSGGKGADEDISEAECMFNYLKARGISSDRIYLEDQSTSTYENLKFSSEIMKENGIDGKIGIVTNEFHETRANMIAQRMGLSSTAVSANTFFVLKPTYYVREVFALVYDAVLR